MKHTHLTLGLLCCAAGLACAQFKPAHIPEKATWLAQLDMKALRSGTLIETLTPLLDEGALRQIAWFHIATGLNLTNDLDTLVLFGKGNVPTNAVLALYGRFDVPRITTLLGTWAAKDFINRAVGERSLLSWTDNDGQRSNLCFIDPTHLVFSRNEQEAVEAIKQAASPAAPNTVLATAMASVTNRFGVLQMNNVADFVADNQQLVILKDTDALVLELFMTPGEGGIEGALALNVGNPEQATLLQQILLGLQAILTMQAKENPEAAALAQKVKVGLNEQRVGLRMKLPQQDLKQMVAAEVAKRLAPDPAPEPPNNRQAF